MSHKSILRIVVEPLAIAVVGALALRTTVAAFSIPSASMTPALLAGDHILVTPYDGPLWHVHPERGDVVVFRRGQEVLIKRIVALPSETVEVRNRDILVNDRVLTEPWAPAQVDNGAVPPVKLPPASYFVMGDNRLESLDSRAWGAVERGSMIGKARIIFWSTAGPAWSGATAAASTGERSTPHPAPGRLRWSRVLSVVH